MAHPKLYCERSCDSIICLNSQPQYVTLEETHLLKTTYKGDQRHLIGKGRNTPREIVDMLSLHVAGVTGISKQLPQFRGNVGMLR